MEENLNQQKPSVPTPPAPEITIRTMDSDIKAIGQGGGEMITPQPFTPEETRTEEPKPEAKFDIPGYTGPEKPIFAPTGAISAEQEQPQEKKTNKWKVIGIIVGILIVLVGFGLLGYFIVSTWLFPKEMPAVQ
jgi:hypothetical protein